LDRFRIVLRGHVYYTHDRKTGQRASLNTKNVQTANRLLQAKNEAYEQPLLNTARAKVFLTAQDPLLVQRTWQDVMVEYSGRGKESTQERVHRALKTPAFRLLAATKLVETPSSVLDAILKMGAASTNNYLRRLHNLAVRRGWLLNPILKPDDWPKRKPLPRRAITAEEHQRFLSAETDPERKLYHMMLWETGAAQSDCAELCFENVDQEKQVLVYHRKKTGEKCQLAIGPSLRDLLTNLPQSGPLFPKQRLIEAKHRAAEFRRRRMLLGIEGISLHSYRYAWAERACKAGYPERFAQAALGHKSKAVHWGYAKRADVICPSLDDYISAKAA
jgi:integrase